MDTEFVKYQERIEALELENSILREKMKLQHSLSEKAMDSERKFRTLFENSQAAISFFDSDYQLVMQNDTNAQMLGGKKEDFIGKNIHDFFPENAAVYIERFEQVIATGEAKLFEDAYTLPGGTKWFSSLLQPVFNYKKQLEGIQVIAIDITEKKQFEHALNESNKRYQLLAENISDIIIQLDRNFKPVYLSPSVKQVTGYPSEELMDNNTFSFVLHEDRERLKKEIELQIQQKKVHRSTEYRIVCKEGYTKWLGASSRYLYTAKGDFDGMITVARDITKHKTAEDNLIKNKTILQEAEQLSNIGSFEWDISENSITISVGWQRIHGVNKTHLTTEELMKIAHPDDLQRINKAFESAIRNTKPYQIEHRIIRQSDKAIRIIKAKGKVFFDKNGKPLKMYGSSEDITEQKKIEIALKDSLRDLELAQKIANIGNWKYDPAVGIPEWSDQIYKIYDRDPKSGPPRIDEYKILYEPEQYQIFSEAIQKAIDEGKPYDIELKLQLNNITKWIHVICKPDHKKTAKGYFLRGTIQDISEQKMAEQALKESEEKFRSLAENTADGLVVFNSKNGHEYVSPAYIKLFGYSHEEVFKRDTEDISALIHPEDRESTMNKIYGAIENKMDNITYEYRLKHKKGHYIWRRDHAKFIYDDKGALLKSYVICSDITERKQVEEALIESNAIKDKIFSIIAHDLRSPFNNILALMEMLIGHTKDFEEAEIDKYLQVTNSLAKNTLGLLDNLLNWAKSQTGRLEFNPEQLILSAVIREVLESTNPVAHNKNIRLHYAANKEITVLADLNMLETILRNLISNAIKFTNPKGKIDIRVSQNDQYTLIAIADTGVGMDEGAQKKLFRLESNVSTRGTAKEKGTGLGLILCKDFVEKHGGKIWVESQIGKGTTFKFTLPMK